VRVVFMGSPEFAVPSLKALCRHHEVVAVYTRPDCIRGRGKSLAPTPVKTVALEEGIPVEQPQTLRSEIAVESLRTYAPDVICVAAYGLILPSGVLEIPPFGCINVHASLLPRHRGAAPVHRAILEGDEITGVTIMLMEEGLDTGPTAVTRPVSVAGKYLDELSAELSCLGAEALIETLSAVCAGVFRWSPQDESKATYAAKITAEDMRLDPGLRVVDALRRIRASSTSARAKVIITGCSVEVIQARIAEERVDPGELRAVSGGLLAGFADGALWLDRLRAAGKSPVDGKAFACGRRLSTEERWASES